MAGAMRAWRMRFSSLSAAAARLSSSFFVDGV